MTLPFLPILVDHMLGEENPCKSKFKGVYLTQSECQCMIERMNLSRQAEYGVYTYILSNTSLYFSFSS